ncbi:MAG: sensor histidine kinase, partial [Chloroflexota bacterium]
CFGYGPWLEEVWFNYIGNAILYGGRPAKVIISSVVEANQVCYWVTDNGYGMDYDLAEHIFEPFYRINHYQNRGNGLGLSIAKKIVERLDGCVGLRTKLGLGSSFFFTLPYIHAEKQLKPQKQMADVERRLQYRHDWQFE